MSIGDGENIGIEDRLKSLERQVEQLTPDNVAELVKEKIARELNLDEKLSDLRETVQNAVHGEIEQSTNILTASLAEKSAVTGLETRVSQLELKNDLVNLENRVHTLEAEPDKPSSSKHMELAELPFKTVLDADYHLDDKASRILSAMAFLTAAAAAIFAKAYSPGPPTDYERKIEAALSSRVDSSILASATASVVQSLKPSSVCIFGIDLSLFTFLCFMLFVLTGVALYLAALGPALNKPSSWLASGGGSLKSRLFYDLIGKLDRETWKEHWLGKREDNTRKNTSEDLEGELESDYVTEAHLLAEKARGKYLWMSLGSVSFRLAILCLGPLVASLFAPNLTVVRGVSIVGIILVIGTVVFERLTRPPRPHFRLTSLHYWVIWLLGVETLLVIYLPLIILKATLEAYVYMFLVAGAVISLLCLIKAFSQALRPEGKDAAEINKNRKKALITGGVFSLLLILCLFMLWQVPNYGNSLGHGLCWA